MNLIIEKIVKSKSSNKDLILRSIFLLFNVCELKWLIRSSCFYSSYWWWVSEVHVIIAAVNDMILFMRVMVIVDEVGIIVLSIDNTYFPNIVVLFSNIPFDINWLFDMPNLFIYIYICIYLYIIINYLHKY